MHCYWCGKDYIEFSYYPINATHYKEIDDLPFTEVEYD